ncbi:odorant receptor 11 [Apis mellifera]|uniref:Odorant receptor n=1 Tax=Apis mellifera TaxID=7460 RepID=A0A7M6UWX0_APIME|nr:odorant receptor 11 [Apis mellifera]|eukprot:NP_001229891.1 odorant receptor 11 [Apis mellifera]
MVQIRNAKEGLKHTFWFAYPFSRTLGYWPLVSPSAFTKFFNSFTIFTLYFLELIVLIPGLLYVLQVKNPRTKIKLLMPHLNSIAQMAKYTIILQRAKEFSKLLDEIKKDWLLATEENRQIFSERASIEHKLTTVIVVTMYGGGFFYRTILPLSKGKILLPNNMTVRLLPCPSYFGSLNEQATPNYEIIFTLQVLGGFIIYTVLCGTKSACLMLCLHMCGLLKILTNKVMDLTNDSDEQVVQEKIVHIVEYQTRIKEFLNQLDQFVPAIYLIEVVIQVLIICIIGYCIIMEWEDSNAMAMVIYVVFQVTCVIGTFSVCYVGQLLLDESENIRQAYNTLNWYRLPVKKARSLILLILMSHYPIKVTAGRIMDLSLVTFTSIIKSAVGYMNMLRTVT